MRSDPTARDARISAICIIATLALLIFQNSVLAHAAGDPNEARVAWLKSHATRLKAIDPANEEYSDLLSLKKTLKDARVVCLGEQSHGDGATFQAKVRLIKFLHSEMGFDVIAFESGLFDCSRAWDAIKRGDDPVQAASKGIFSVWTDSAEVRPLFSYIGAEAKTGHPLELTGFDLQFTGSYSRDLLVAELEKSVAALDPEFAKSPTTRTAIEGLRTLFTNPQTLRQAPPSEQQKILDSVDTFAQGLRERLAKQKNPDRDAELLGQTVASASTFLKFLSGFNPQKLDPAIMNLRDQQMGANMLWLAQSRFPNRKIIVWGATSHVSRNRQSIETDIDKNMIPMGDYLRKALGNKVYTIGFTAYEGQMGFPREGERGQPQDIGQADDGSLEHLFATAGFEFAFLDFSHLGADGAWLRDKHSSRPMGYAPMLADWSQVLDGMVFIRTMTPSTRP